MGQQFILEHCGKVAGCKPNPAPDFCRGSCIPKQYANNGIEECVDGSDEGAIGMKKNVYSRLQLGLDLLPKLIYTSKQLYWYHRERRQRRKLTLTVMTASFSKESTVK